jgi:hypothetical protein
MNSQTYLATQQRRLMQEYQSRKFKEFQQFENEIRTLRNNNGQIFMGGYTEPAKKSYDARELQIAFIEQQKKEELTKKWDGSVESFKAFKKVIEDEEKAERLNRYSINSPGVPRVGGAAGAHAASHGGGFNHPGVYAGGVW